MQRMMTLRRLVMLGSALGTVLGWLATIESAAAQTAPATPPATSSTTTAAPPATGTAPGDQSPAQAAGAATPSGPGITVGPLKLYGQIEGGIAGNPANPSSPNGPANGLNFGQLFTDRANQPTLNQLLLGVEKPIDPKATGFAWGARFFFMYGSDARYTHFMGVFDRSINQKYQVDIVEGDVKLHLPVLTSGGVDATIGMYPSPLGYEVIDPKGNPFYTHSYIFNFGLPFKATGAYAVLHVNDTIDLYGGADTGVNTSITATGNNNGAIAGMFGVGFNNLSDGKFTALWLSHFGPENPSMFDPSHGVVGANSRYRVYNDAYGTIKVNDKLSLTTELDWVVDAEIQANAFGAAQYASYALTDTVTLNGRAEIFSDQKNFFVAGFQGNFAAAASEFGYGTSPDERAFLPDPSNPVVSSPGTGNTYSEITLGVTWAPSLPPLNTLMIRPEVRWDHSYGQPAFNNFGNNNQFLISADAILGF
jgi:Putative beta-barrel porin-2, OmpL-like. bbp2